MELPIIFKVFSFRPNRRGTHSGGFSLIELMLAMALLSVILVSVLAGQWSIGDLLMNNVRSFVAQNIVKKQLGEIFIRETISPSAGFINESTTTALFNINSGFVGRPYTRCGHLLGVETSWKSGWGKEQGFQTFFLNPSFSLAREYGGDCSGQPRHFSDSNFIQNSVVDVGEIINSLDIFDGTAFVGVQTGLAVVQFSTPANFSIIQTPAVINDVDAIAGTTFAALHSSTTQVAVFDTDQMNLIATTTLPNVAGSRPQAVSIFYSNEKIFVGTKRTAGHEFHIFDVSDPHNLAWLGSREMNHNINDIVVKDGYAFLATSGNVRDLIILDIHDPTSPVSVLEIDLPGNEDGRSVAISYNYIFLGRHKSTTPDRNELWVLRYWFDTDTGDMSIETTGSAKTGGDVTGISNAGSEIFVSTNNTAKELQVFRLDSKTNVLTQVSTRNLPTNISAIDIENEHVVASSGSELYIYEQQ